MFFCLSVHVMQRECEPLVEWLREINDVLRCIIGTT
jgi:nitrate reductase cytochrome c-type subunit